jgi:hypothetical protein
VNRKRYLFLLLILLFFVSGAVLAQIYSGRGGSSGRGIRGGIDRGFNVGRGRGGGRNQGYRDQRSIGRSRGSMNQQYLDSSINLLNWEIDPEFSKDVFTFVRIRYDSGYSGYGGFGGRGGRRSFGLSGGPWNTDYPDSDNNFSFRLHQVTSIEVNPRPVVLDITNPELFNYPFIYIVEPGNLALRNDEIPILRKYLLNGGFLMLDDFWGQAEWYNVYTQMKRVFPEREPRVLPMNDPVFDCVFKIKEKPQIPAIDFAINRDGTLSGITTERSDAPEAFFYGIYDDKGRMMVIICRDTDLGDGWEREGVSEAYFREFSEKKAYPLGINIVFYAMTH